MEDYSKLEGKLVEIKNDAFTKGIVDGCDFDIGITISNVNNKKQHHICLNGKNSPLHHRSPFKTDESYKAMFDFVVVQIKKGVCDFKLGRKAENKHKCTTQSMEIANQSECAFNQ